MTFIHKPRKANYIEHKAYRSFGLASFMLKTMEKLLDRHSRNEISELCVLHQ